MGRSLSNLIAPVGANRKRKRVGRGHGSGDGTTAGRGQKGQKARTGASQRPGFEGGQMPLQRRLPKRGFVSPFRVSYSPVNVGQLAASFDAGATVDLVALQDKGLVPRRARRWKLLAEGELGGKFEITAQAASSAARAKVEAAGGTVSIVAVVQSKA